MHSSYSPLSYPVNFDVGHDWERYHRHLNRFLLYFADETRLTSKCTTVEHDFIKFIYLENLPESSHLVSVRHEGFLNK